MIPLSKPLKSLIDHLVNAGIRPILVGGFVRDHFTGHKTADLDMELYRLPSLDALETLLKPFGTVNLVGKSFGVVKLSYGGYTIDFAPPRTESKQGRGHKGFGISWHSDIDYADAARRRDFTINSIGYDPVREIFLDPFEGIGDLQAKRLRCVDPSTFVEDPLRVLRALQFAARFDLHCDDTLLELCSAMIRKGALDELPKERIFEEIKKLLLLSPRPSIGFELLRSMHGLGYFSPLEKLEHTPQDPASHPEGDVWIHTMMSIDTMAAMRTGDHKRDLVLMLAILLHDIGKPETTLVEEGKYNAPKHAEAGVETARRWLQRLTEDKSLIDSVLPLVRYHGWPRKLYRSSADDSSILRLATQVRIDNLIRVAEADFFGRTFAATPPKRFEAGEWLYERAAALGILSAPQPPLLMGRDLVDAGMNPSQAFKTILDEAYEAQLEGTITTRSEALEWLCRRIVTEL